MEHGLECPWLFLRNKNRYTIHKHPTLRPRFPYPLFGTSPLIPVSDTTPHPHPCGSYNPEKGPFGQFNLRPSVDSPTGPSISSKRKPHWTRRCHHWTPPPLLVVVPEDCTPIDDPYPFPWEEGCVGVTRLRNRTPT